jgi:hypothetical protein
MTTTEGRRDVTAHAPVTATVTRHGEPVTAHAPTRASVTRDVTVSVTRDAETVTRDAEAVTRDVTGRTPIDRGSAALRLTLTASNNRSGTIHGPFTTIGYSVAGALRMLDRARDDQIFSGQWNGIETVQAVNAGGEHIWYIRRDPADPDPWGDK